MNKLLACVIFLFISSCSSAQFAPSRLGQVYPVKTLPAAIELFRSADPIKKYIEIGAMNACCSSDANGLINLMREKASQNGGDALLGLEANARGGVSATVIRYQ